ncbi:MAG TPA: hypothetical protein VG458_05775 [Solirubrobacterales bacterium]|nr:hypothetical protein [Solirubrobacterales bacterium]
MIEPQRALRDIRRNLRESVMPELSSAHSRAVLAAALGILDEVVDRVRLDEGPAAATVAEMLPALEGWERALAAPAPAAAAAIAESRRQAAAASDPLLARTEVLGAAECAVAAAWGDFDPAERDQLLGQIRQLLRADTIRQKGEK